MTPTLNKHQWKCAYAKVPGPGSTCKKHLIHFFSCPLCSRLSWKCLFVHSGVLGGMAQLADSSAGCKGSNTVRTWEWSRVRAEDPTEDRALASCHSSSCYGPQEQGQCTCLLLRASVSTPARWTQWWHVLLRAVPRARRASTYYVLRTMPGTWKVLDKC